MPWGAVLPSLPTRIWVAPRLSVALSSRVPAASAVLPVASSETCWPAMRGGSEPALPAPLPASRPTRRLPARPCTWLRSSAPAPWLTRSEAPSPASTRVSALPSPAAAMRAPALMLTTCLAARVRSPSVSGVAGLSSVTLSASTVTKRPWLPAAPRLAPIKTLAAPLASSCCGLR